MPTGLYHAIAGETETDCAEGGGAKFAGHAGRGAAKVVPDQSQERNRPRGSSLQRYANGYFVIYSHNIQLTCRDFCQLQDTNVFKACLFFLFIEKLHVPQRRSISKREMKEITERFV